MKNVPQKIGTLVNIVNTMNPEKYFKAKFQDFCVDLFFNEDEELGANLDKINKMITEKGGTVSSVDQWGKRKLAYPIKQFAEGNYVLMNFSSDPVLCQQLEASLRISEDILRHLLINVELS